MKKLTLIAAMTSVFCGSVAFSGAALAESLVANDIEIFTKDFGLSVKKESEVVVELPTEELVELHFDQLQESPNGTYKPFIGPMVFSTTATHCEATITTKNGFELKGNNSEEVLATYNVEYMAGPAVAVVPPPSGILFGTGLPATQQVACESAELFMDVLTTNDTAPTDFYGDVIHVEVRAES